MIEETLRTLEERIRSAEGPGDPEREGLLGLVAELRSELAALSETHAEDAAHLAEHARDAGAAPGTAIEDSVRDFETRHPRVTGLVRSLLQTLADAGI